MPRRFLIDAAGLLALENTVAPGFYCQARSINIWVIHAYIPQ
jgi:hypothetical protein